MCPTIRPVLEKHANRAIRSLRPRFAKRFLHALAAINLTRRASSFSIRAKRIKAAADYSMASAVSGKNCRKAWSRAILMRSLRWRRFRLRRRRRRRRRAGWNLKEDHHEEEEIVESEGQQEETLRRLLPGGKGMDFCGLLEEAADYIKSLTVQVQVMQNILDNMSD